MPAKKGGEAEKKIGKIVRSSEAGGGSGEVSAGFITLFLEVYR